MTTSRVSDGQADDSTSDRDADTGTAEAAAKAARMKASYLLEFTIDQTAIAVFHSGSI